MTSGSANSANITGLLNWPAVKKGAGDKQWTGHRLYTEKHEQEGAACNWVWFVEGTGAFTNWRGKKAGADRGEKSKFFLSTVSFVNA